MVSNTNYKNIKAWPFVEAHRILAKLDNLKTKNTINFETGYGPSGVPHIGTFAEVLRTNMIRNALKEIKNIDSKLITFSDDLDALKKVPEDYPYPEKLSKYINFPLSSIPDFTEQYPSYAHKNNNLLKEFLNNFEFDYEFISSTESYKSGIFDKCLLKILENYESIINIILPTLRKERRESYSPFLPICKATGKVLEVPIKIVSKENGVIAYKNNNNKFVETLITKGNCKLQWKVDWAMRWSALKVDYEMNGKDLIPSFELSKKIAKFIYNIIPTNMSYELFLDQNGEKISKSKGNGLSINEWMTYGTKESLSLFMYQNPRRAKRLYFDCIPKSMDEYKRYFKNIEKKNEQLFENPTWHIHEGKIPSKTYPIEFSTLINLVTALNTSDIATINNFCLLYIKDNLAPEEQNQLKEIIKLAIRYFQKFIFPTLKKRKPDVEEKKIIENIIKEITKNKKEISAEEYQNLIYRYGKEIYPDNLRKWFVSLYQILFGSANGPRLGSLFYLYKRDKVLKILQDAIN
ncbi:lysine--tRNA ligase [Alphaproteobacteria bacterium]|nr:lysine--tRNA ligase [Alphaproteobacteria bacterium]